MIKLSGLFTKPGSSGLLLGRNILQRARFSVTNRSAYQDTIYALSTGWGKSAISVIRVSGPNASQALDLTRKKPK